MNKQKILFVYLNTGNGHVAPAKVLKNDLLTRYGEENVEVSICHGFGENQKFARFFFEDGYHISSAAIPGSYSLFYDINTWSPMLQITRHLVAWNTTAHIEKLIEEHGITKVVCFHFAIAGAVNRAIRKVQNKNPEKPKIPFVIVVTDPFSAHPSWFLEKNADFVVFSNTLKNEVKKNYGIGCNESNDNKDFKVGRINSFPFILNPVYREKNLKESSELQILRDTLNNCNELSPTRQKAFLTLVAGGGEGLPDMYNLIRCFVQKVAHEADTNMVFVAVCGRNKADYLKLKLLHELHPEVKLFVYGYVSCMPELLRLSECVVTKAGASMIMETLASHKPLIMSTYIHGQELGNVRYVVQNKCGFFIQKPNKVFEKLIQLKNNHEYYDSIVNNLNKLDVKPDTDLLTEYIYNL